MVKLFKYILLGFILLFATTAFAQEKTVIIGWNAVDFANADSDLAVSGYKIYESTGGGTLVEIGSEPTTSTSHTIKRTSINGNCYAVKSFNQYGESAMSSEVCTNVPDVPSGIGVKVTIEITIP